MTAPVPQLREADYGGADSLERALQKALNDTAARLDALEAKRPAIIRVELQTANPNNPGVTPYPVRLQNPGFTPAALVLGRVVNVTLGGTPGITSSAQSVYWHADSQGLYLDYVPGLLVSTRYSLTLVAYRG